ncbi:MAG TPA: ferritin-like domain-containing protein [Dyella sp.]|uniref:ferritin-like domain-containing protein n=1 Tax=Dyella sp. TaxID=1869338 RepID=UPI002CB8798D|nr:ferritin-like domain-containing protein [Dyella sp.]HUB90820.1 ferritin-like domain-containing protein [Dyella sp.]
MVSYSPSHTALSREQALHALYEAAELEHCLMCTYLYAAFSLKSAVEEGVTAGQLEAIKRWKHSILQVAIEEMGHLMSVWNITVALGGAPRVGRSNFPLDPGYLPAGVVVKLAPFNLATLQHFIYLERPAGSTEPDGEGFEPERHFVRGANGPRLTPMGINYDTVGEFYQTLGKGLRLLVDEHGEAGAMCGNPALQLSSAEVSLPGANKVICLKTALAAFESIITQGEGAQENTENSHYQRFAAIRAEYQALLAADPSFRPAFPAATNPVLRRPPRPEGRVWLEDADAIATVDLANAAYGLMQRLLAYTYTVPAPDPDKNLSLDLGIGLMRALAPLAERAARLPAGPSNPDCHAGVSFITLRDASPLPPGPSARRFFRERFRQLAEAAERLSTSGDPRTLAAASVFAHLARQAEQGFDLERPAPSVAASASAAAAPAPAPPPSAVQDGIEQVEGEKLSLLFDAKRCIHARFCVTGAPKVFLANVQGAWLFPDAMDVERLAEIAHACPSGAIQYRRRDGRPDETAPPVNLAATREAGPYAFRGDLRLSGKPAGFRATLCRCGASKNKPFCDGSHHDAGFTASGEPPTGPATDALPVRDGPLQIDPQRNGPLCVRGNLEIVSGTGRMVARVTSTYLCRCGHSQNKPFCDGSHARVGFIADGD